MNKYLTEFLGTFFLVFAVAFSGNPLAIGLTLAVAIYCGGHISGAHYNPAVSIAVLLRGKLPASDFVPYVLAQLLGAAAAAFVFHTVTGKVFTPAPSPEASFLAGFMVEFIATFLLALVVLTVATTKKFEKSTIYGFAIGLTVTAMALSVGSISGGAFNPAVGIGPSIGGLLFGAANFTHSILYLAGPAAGGAVAALAFKAMGNE